MFWSFLSSLANPSGKAESNVLSKPGINSPALTSPSMPTVSGLSTRNRDVSGLKRRALVKSPAKKPAKPKAQAPAAKKLAPKAQPKLPAKKTVAPVAAKKNSAPTAAKKPANKKLAVKKPVPVSKAPVKKVPTKTVAKPAVVKKAAAKPASKSPVKPAAPKAKATPVTSKVAAKAAPTKTAAKTTAAKVPVKPAAPARKPVAPVKPAAVAKPSVVVTPTKPVGKRAAKKVMMEQMTQAEVVPTHAPDAAKATFSLIPERLMTPLPVQSPIKKDAKRANNWKTTPAEQLADADITAMPDSEYMNDVQQAFFRSKLQQLKTDILANAGQTTENLREDTSVMPDPADRATIEEEHALELRTRDRERKLLKKIDQSIQRIDAGEYGYCDETGEPIGVGRLMARPTANLSLEAQQRRELKQKMFGD